jgi:hypothetical protein
MVLRFPLLLDASWCPRISRIRSRTRVVTSPCGPGLRCNPNQMLLDFKDSVRGPAWIPPSSKFTWRSSRCKAAA